MASQMSGKLWQPDGAYDSLATVTIGATGVSSVTFAGIPNTYKHLQIRATLKTNRATFGNDGLYLKVNGASSNYAFHYVLGDGAATSAAPADQPAPSAQPAPAAPPVFQPGKIYRDGQGRPARFRGYDAQGKPTFDKI
jgi:hypothetical protein